MDTHGREYCIVLLEAAILLYWCHLGVVVYKCRFNSISDVLSHSFAGYADWSPRAWHGATSFKNTVWVVGGTPITNDVWFAKNITYIGNRRAPLTRAMYVMHIDDGYILTAQNPCRVSCLYVSLLC